MLDRILILTHEAYENTLLSDALRLHNVNVVGGAHDLATAENMVHNLNPDVMVIGVHQDHLQYLTFAREQRAARPHLGLVYLFSCPDLRLYGIKEDEIPYGSQLVLRESVSDIYILKEAISRARDKAATGKEFEWFGSHSNSPHHTMVSVLRELTNAQMDTLRLIIAGKSNSEIGRIRFVTEKSVEQMVSRIAQHLGISAERSENLRVLITREYFHLITSPKYR